jgi:hypothetical protein
LASEEDECDNDEYTRSHCFLPCYSK